MADQQESKLIAYRVLPETMKIVPANAVANWMEEHPAKLAHSCQPLLLANQTGWCLLAPSDVEVKWNGRSEPKDLSIRSDTNSAISNCGLGIVTWRIPYLFRTPPGWQLWVKGPTNCFLDGAIPLEGIVETDHASETFTMSWKMTRKGTVRWAQGDAICQLVPIQVEPLRQFEPAIVYPAPPDIQEAFRNWAIRRMRNNQIQPYRVSHEYRRSARVKRLALRPFRGQKGSSYPMTEEGIRPTQGF
jgi:hypothetical protein